MGKGIKRPSHLEGASSLISPEELQSAAFSAEGVPLGYDPSVSAILRCGFALAQKHTRAAKIHASKWMPLGRDPDGVCALAGTHRQGLSKRR
jgi:hypothetical protein